MDYEILIKTTSVLLGAIGAAKLIYDLSINKRGRMREEYKFAKEFLQDVSSSEQLHPFLREKGFQAIAGDNDIGADEIEYLLSLKGPERALRDYVLGRPYFKHLPDAGNLQITFREKYKNVWFRRLLKLFYFIMYLGLAFLAFSPLVLSKFFHIAPAQIFIAFAICVSLFGPLAWIALKAGTRIYRAEKLVDNQDKHTPRIALISNKGGGPKAQRRGSRKGQRRQRPKAGVTKVGVRSSFVAR